MRYLLALMGLGLAMAAFVACVDDVESGGETTLEHELCSSACGTLEGQDWSDCVAEECGPTGGGGDGGGGGYGGGSGGTGGATCVYLRVDHCWGDFWQTVDWCCYSSGASLTCYAAGRGCEYAPAP